MEKPRIFTVPFSSIYPLYIQKAEKKGKTKKEVDEIIFWLTGYDEHSLQQQIIKEQIWKHSLNKHLILIRRQYSSKELSADIGWKKLKMI